MSTPEYQINDRLSFMRFLGLELKDKVPDAKTIWLFKERLIEAKVSEKLFEKFGKELAKQNLIGKEGTIIDATIVEAPIQHNSKEENEQIKHRLFSAAEIARLKNTSSLLSQTSLINVCAENAHELNNLQSCHFVQLFNFNEGEIPQEWQGEKHKAKLG